MTIYSVFLLSQEANKPENRAERPWIIVMGHRPMYCSNNDSDDCTRKFALVCVIESEIFGRVLFLQNFANGKNRLNKTSGKW